MYCMYFNCHLAKFWIYAYNWMRCRSRYLFVIFDHDHAQNPIYNDRFNFDFALSLKGKGK